MNIKTRIRSNYLVVHLNGDLDVDAVPHIRNKIEAQLKKKRVKNLIIDLGQVDFIDSTGVGVLLGRYRNIKSKNGNMVLVNPNSNIERVLELAGITNLVDICDSVEHFFSQQKGGDYLVQ